MVLRELFVLLGLDIDEASFAKGELAAKVVEKGLDKLVETARELVESFKENTKEAIEFGNKLAKTSQSIGIASDALQELQYAAQLSDISADEMSQTLGILARNMHAAKQGSEEAQKAFKGIEYKKADGTLKSVDEALATIAEKFSNMPNGVEKTALAMKLFGRSGKQLIPLLNEGADGIDELREEAHELGLVMGEEAVEASEKLNDNLERLHLVGRGLWQQAIAPLLPAIGELVKKFLAWRKENAAILAQKLQGFMKTLITVVGFLGEAFLSLTRNLMRVKAFVSDNLIPVLVAVGSVAAVAGRQVLLAWLKAAAPFAAIAAVLTTLYLVFDDIAGYYEGKDSVFGRFKQALDDWLKPNAKDPWWLTAVKDLVGLLRDAIELKHELDAALGRVSNKEIDRRAGQSRAGISAAASAQTMETARKRVSMGLPLTERERYELEGSGVSPESFVAKYRPGMSESPVAGPPMSIAATPSSRGGSVSSTTNVVINASGMSAEEAEPMIRRVLEDHAEKVNEETAASFSSVP